MASISNAVRGLRGFGMGRRSVVRRSDRWSGAATIAGTNLPVFLVEDYFREAGSFDAVVARYSSLTPE